MLPNGVTKQSLGRTDIYIFKLKKTYNGGKKLKVQKAVPFEDSCLFFSFLFLLFLLLITICDFFLVVVFFLLLLLSLTAHCRTFLSSFKTA